MVSDWKWVTSKHKGRSLGNNPVVTVLTRSLSIVSAIFTIWIFAETRDKPANEKQVTSEQFEDLNGYMEYLNVQMEDVQRSLMQLTCLFDTFHAQSKNKPVSRECLQFIQKNRQAGTYYATVLAKPSHFITNNHIENKNSLSTSMVAAHQELIRRISYSILFKRHSPAD